MLPDISKAAFYLMDKNHIQIANPFHKCRHIKHYSFPFFTFFILILDGRTRLAVNTTGLSGIAHEFPTRSTPLIRPCSQRTRTRLGVTFNFFDASVVPIISIPLSQKTTVMQKHKPKILPLKFHCDGLKKSIGKSNINHFHADV